MKKKFLLLPRIGKSRLRQDYPVISQFSEYSETSHPVTLKNLKPTCGFKILIAILIFFSIACERMLNIEPEDSFIREEFWKIKGDVESALIGSYDAIQACVFKFFVWGELRGELVYVETADKNLSNLHRLDIIEENGYCKWDEIYSALNKVNTVIKFAPVARENDNTFTNTELNYYLGECLTLRALLYFYLARTFYEFPYITEPSESDQQKYSVEATLGTEVLDYLIEDLLKAKELVRKEFDNEFFEKEQITSEDIKKAYKKGRVTKPVIWALLTDIYLTKGEYEKAASCADSIIENPQFSLVTTATWMSNFFPGNSTESIFELQYSNTFNEESDIATWFTNSFGKGDVQFRNVRNYNTSTYKYWEGDDYDALLTVDKRGINGTFNQYNKPQIWKWIGKSNNGIDMRDNTSNDANWIFYRLADIKLMKAEALNRLGQTQDAVELVKEIRKRATGITPAIEGGTINSFEEIILDERARELAAEGKRWFDLVRIAQRQNNYEVIGNRIADAYDPPERQTAWKAKVFKPLSWYLPVYKGELELNVMLKQNPYYAKAE